MESYELSNYENWMCVEDPFLQIQSHMTTFLLHMVPQSLHNIDLPEPSKELYVCNMKWHTTLSRNYTIIYQNPFIVLRKLQ